MCAGGERTDGERIGGEAACGDMKAGRKVSVGGGPVDCENGDAVGAVFKKIEVDIDLDIGDNMGGRSDGDASLSTLARDSY